MATKRREDSGISRETVPNEPTLSFPNRLLVAMNVTHDHRKSATCLRRVAKWKRMIGDDQTWSNWDKTCRDQGKTLKRRVRKGIPESFRKGAWFRMSGGLALASKKENSGTYTTLSQKKGPCEQQIAVDLDRSFPEHPMFAKGGKGIPMMERVLTAYSNYDPEVGYCQGMNFLAGFLLMHIGEEEAFWTLVGLLNDQKFGCRSLYKRDMRLAQKSVAQFDAVLAEFLPALKAHMDSEDLPAGLYAPQWFLALFTNIFPLDLVTRVWDCFLLEGWKVIFRVGLAMIQLHSKQMMQLDCMGGNNFIRDLPEKLAELGADRVMEVAFAPNMKRAMLKAAGDQWEKENPAVATTNAKSATNALAATDAPVAAAAAVDAAAPADVAVVVSAPVTSDSTM